MNHINEFNQNKDIKRDLDDIDRLKDFFKDIIDVRYSFWLKKKTELIDQATYLNNNLILSVKYKNRVNKYNPENSHIYLEKINQNIDYVNTQLTKINNLIKMIDTKLTKNKESINAIVANYIKENKMKARNESLQLYNKIKDNDERNLEIIKVLIKYHNKIIQPGIEMIINFI
jgi:hypothetical protein